MKCRKCGNELSDIDTICLNCGTLVNRSANDLYDDINRDDEDEKTDDYEETKDLEYSDELDQLLNSYTPEKTINDDEDIKNEDDDDDSNNFLIDEDDDSNSEYDTDSNDDYYVNEESNQNNDENTYYNNDNDSYYDLSGYTNNELDDYDVRDLVKLNDSNNNEDVYKDLDEKKFKIPDITFKVVFIIAAIVLVVIGVLLAYKFIKNNNGETSYKIDKKDELTVESKYSLSKYPNFIEGKSWICGDASSDGSLTSDRTSYFQYDFHTDSTYLTKVFRYDDSIESGNYSVSLEDIANDQYTYKITAVADLAGGYKTKYSFTIITNKQGTTATYKINSSLSACEELNYYNSKLR